MHFVEIVDYGKVTLGGALGLSSQLLRLHAAYSWSCMFRVLVCMQM